MRRITLVLDMHDTKVVFMRAFNGTNLIKRTLERGAGDPILALELSFYHELAEANDSRRISFTCRIQI